MQEFVSDTFQLIWTLLDRSSALNVVFRRCIHAWGRWLEHCSSQMYRYQLSPLYTELRPLYYLWAIRKLTGQFSGWLKPGKSCFCEMAPATFVTSHTKVAEWRQNHCHIHPKVAGVAQWSPQSSFSACYLAHREGRKEAEVLTRFRNQVCRRMHLLCGDHCPIIAHPLWTTEMCAPSSASFEQPASSATPEFKTLFRLCRPWLCLDILCASFEWPRQPFGPCWTSRGDLARFMVTEVRHKHRSLWVLGRCK